MGRACTVCRHPNRDALDALLVESNAALRDLAARHSLSPSALRRHRLEHLPRALIRAAEAQETTRGESLLDHVRRLQARSALILEKAERSGDLRTALGALRELRGILELLGRLALKNGAVVDVAVVERYTQTVFEVLYEYVPEDRLEAAIAKLKQAIQNEALATDEEPVVVSTGDHS